MKTNPQSCAQPAPHRRVRPMVLFLIGVVSLTTLVAVWSHRARRVDIQQPGSENVSASALTAPKPVRHDPPHKVAATQPARREPTIYAQPEPTPGMRQLVNSLVELKTAGSVVTEEQALAWRTNLQSLIQQGTEAVPAISEFLAKNVDYGFSAEERKLLGYSSLRSVMLDALAQIGGPVSVNAMSQVLQTAADPREIAVLGQYLEKLDPAVHREEIFNAAREALGMAAGGGLPNRDVAPLFEVMQQFGGAGAVADLEHSAEQWNYYAMIALGGLPDQAGIPSLSQIAGSQEGVNPGAKIAALGMLAEAVPQSQDARDALVNLIRQNKLSASQWAALTPMLAGNRMVFHDSAFENVLAMVSPDDVKSVNMPASNQLIATAPLGAMTIEQIDQRKAFLDDLLAATSDPTAVQALQRAKDLLAQRLFQIAGAAGK